MNKRKLGVVLIFALLAIIVFWAIGYLKKGGDWENVVPEESDILTMKATWFTPEGKYEFTVEREYFSKILSHLQPAQRYKGHKGLMIAFLHLAFNDGKTAEVAVFFEEKGAGMFYVKTPEDPTFYYYRGGNSSAFKSALREACEGSKDKKKIVDQIVDDDF